MGTHPYLECASTTSEVKSTELCTQTGALPYTPPPQGSGNFQERLSTLGSRQTSSPFSVPPRVPHHPYRALPIVSKWSVNPPNAEWGFQSCF